MQRIPRINPTSKDGRDFKRLCSQPTWIKAIEMDTKLGILKNINFKEAWSHEAQVVIWVASSLDILIYQQKVI